MRILFVYDALFPDRTGGVEHRNRALARGLAERGHEVTLAGWASAMPEPPDGVTMLELPYSTNLYDGEGKRRVWAAIQFARAVATLKVERWDVIETSNIPYVHLWPLWLRTRLVPTRLIVTWHELMGPAWDDYVTSWKAPIFAAIERWATRIGDLQAAVSEFTRDRLKEAVGMVEAQMPVIPNGIPSGRLQTIRRESGTPFGQGPAFVFVGRLHANKRIHLMLDALAELDMQRPYPWFRIIGAGPSEEILQERVRQLGLGSHVEFTGRIESVQKVWRLMAECDVAVQPSRREGFGMFPLEAMALGLPVIFWSAEGSAIDEVVRTGVEGMRIQGDDPRAFRACLKEIRSDYVAFSDRALERARRFDWKRATSSFEELIA